jgi:hypothetical protein
VLGGYELGRVARDLCSVDVVFGVDHLQHVCCNLNIVPVGEFKVGGVWSLYLRKRGKATREKELCAVIPDNIV